MTNTPAVFSTPEQSLRVFEIDGQPWFAAGDVLAALDLHRKALARLDPEDKGVRSTHTPGGAQRIAIVNESGLYALILGSRKAEARTFKRWVTSEVLPSIRRTGQYRNCKRVTGEDLRRVQHRVAAIVDGLHFGAAWRHLIWRRLRAAAQCPAPYPFEEHHLPTVLAEVARVAKHVEQCKRAQRGAELRQLQATYGTRLLAA